MRTGLRNFCVAALSAAGGVAVGYWLSFPIYQVPPEPTVQTLLPLLSRIDRFCEAHGADFVAPAVAVFMARLPNTLALSLAAGLALRKLAWRRLAFYAVFLVPLLQHSLFWLGVWQLKRGAEWHGVPSDMASLPIAPNARGNTLLILMTFGLFAILVFALRLNPAKSSLTMGSTTGPSTRSPP